MKDVLKEQRNQKYNDYVKAGDTDAQSAVEYAQSVCDRRRDLS